LNRRRVVITGLGVVTPIGIGQEALWTGLRRGISAIRRITRFDPTPFASRVAAEVDGFDPLDYLDARRARRLDRFSQFSLAASRLALTDASLDLERVDRECVGVYIGSALGGIAFAEAQHTSYMAHGIHAVSPQLALLVFNGAGSANVAIELGITGPNLAPANSCASGAVAIGEAFHRIRAGDVDVVLAGAAEAPLSPLVFGSFSIIRAMSIRNDTPETACRPFDQTRDGFVMAEGAGVLVLEDLEHARRRDAGIYAEVIGYGHTNDAYHMTAPRPDGAQSARAITLALRDARLGPTEIEYVNAHASATPLNDKTEALALHRALGARAQTVPVSGTKGIHGHSLGATGAIEAAICALIFQHDFLPPTYNLRMRDPECNLNCLTGVGCETAVTTILSNSFGFGGVNASLIFRRFAE
jgi:3-oxoacyl-[acyl-carrier-protein] synthase II